VELGQLSGATDVVPQKVELAVRLILITFVFLVLVAADAQSTALDGLRRACQKCPRRSVQTAPTGHRGIEVVGDLAKLLIEPVVRIPIAPTSPEIGLKVLDGSSERGLERGKRCRTDL